MDVLTTKKAFWAEYPSFTLFVICLSLLFIRIYFRGDVLLLDESEQVVLAQQFKPGYLGQPPLYSWLQYFFFQFFGSNLIAVALLKYSLLFLSFYCFFLICEIHCESSSIAFYGLASWILIPSIGLDLIKDNTHSITVLLMVTLTWYWLVKPAPANKLLWYLIFGLIVGLGLLSKFNYLLFLIIAISAALSVKEYQTILCNRYIILSLVVSLLMFSPYLNWILKHPQIAFSSAYKLNPHTHASWQGFVKFVQNLLLFTLPVLACLWAFFPRENYRLLSTAKDRLLKRYHLIAVPFLSLLVVIANIHDFKSRWLLPILFLSPLLFLSRLKNTVSVKKSGKFFLIFCLSAELVFLAILVLTQHTDQNREREKQLRTIIQFVGQNTKQDDWIVSDSFWLLGNLASALSLKHLWLLSDANDYSLPKGRCLLVWLGDSIPFWVSQQPKPLVQFISDPEKKMAIAGHTYLVF
ncbi:glycosyltransferase family 39 protein [Legionella jordanis]|uniref:Glycosyl transferase n=1 Tax=Legionella jordanis TaxID=456 RepID=A0A0W0V8L0_9GAMM|nr:glycosyltransferase family 39 protein [Legionella jordanis]KTD16432.1 glycosyl transferase [Legionella jordanis]RMX04366.1 hypothetical protein EAW55_02715 [Legionella jordanis]RMX15557.1 hypothetical protein EAS68_11910 [Legionella jordanis]VEH12108.1 glycosyl transferase [Legionella jordanis]HAT8714995.1 glycosyltransferase family 39 protein [Legionella jordanis]